MLSKKLSYLIATLMVMSGLLIAQNAQADKIYLDPDTLLLTGAVGSEFDLELKVDNVIDLKFFKSYFHFNPEILDTVSFSQGPLFTSAGAGTWPGADLINDDTVMALEDLIYGAGKAVDGPGTLFTIRLKALAPGVADLSAIGHILRDVMGDTILSDAFGATIFVDYPPVPFALLQPYEGEIITKYPRDSVNLVWNSMWSVYPGEGISCRLEYGYSDSFAPEQTTVVSGISNMDTTHTINTSTLEPDGIVFWRVIAVGDLYGYERVTSGSFEVHVMDPIAEFDTKLPVGGQVGRYPMDSIQLVWEASSSVYPGEDVHYRIEYGSSAFFEPGSTTRIPVWTDTTMYLYADDLTDGTYYWRVTAVGSVYGYERRSTSEFRSFEFKLLTPFAPFALLSPSTGKLVNGPPSGFVSFDWSHSLSIYPGETISYRFELSTNPTFIDLIVPAATVADTNYSVLIGELSDGDYFWRVTVVGDIYGFEAPSTPFSNYFSLLIGGAPPADFNLVAPADSAIVNIAYLSEITVDWEDADIGDPYDTILYIFYLGPDTDFISTAILTDTVQDELSIAIPTNDLPLAESLYWRVRAVNRFNLEHWSTTSHGIVFYIVGDVNSDRRTNLADITKVIDYVYLSKLPIFPAESADTNCDGRANLADITRLIDNVYLSKADLICQ